MGYVNDTQSAVIIPPCDMQINGGTWSDQVASNQWSRDKAAAADSSTVRIPLTGIFQNAAGLKGSLVRSVDIWYEVGTAACTSVGAAVYRLTVPADNASPSAPAVVTFTYDAGHDTNAKRYAVQKHRMMLAVTTPIWLAADDVVFVELAVTAAATTVFKMKEARVNFTLRL